MIAASIVGVVVAAVLLVVGLVQSSTTLFYSSIAASVAAAFALLVGVRQLPAAQLPEDDFDVGRNPEAAVRRARPAGRAAVPRQGASVTASGSDATADVRDGMDGLGDIGGPEHRDGDVVDVPADEPGYQLVTAAQAESVAHLGAEVGVIDGRPRYHLAGCLHLLGREVEWLPVMEAVELGFTPCVQCEPVTALLGDPATT